MKQELIVEYARTAVKLLQGDLDYEDPLWKELLIYENELRRYFSQIGVDLIVDRDEGYAFLSQKELDENGVTIGLMRRNPISFEVSLICILLREWLDEFEINANLSPKFYIQHGEIKERIELFFQEQSNRIKLLKDMDIAIRKTVDLGFLKEVEKSPTKIDDNRYWVKPIIKAKITIEQLEVYKEELENHVRSI